jgi:hypothetical protein
VNRPHSRVGEFQQPDAGRSLSLVERQSFFISKVLTGYPKAHDSLEVYYRKLRRAVSQNHQDPADVPRLKVDHEKLRKKWGEDWGLTDPWCLRIVERHLLRLYYEECGWLDEASLLLLHEDKFQREVQAQPFSSPRLLIDLEGWPYTQATRTEFESQAREFCESEIKKYCARMEKRASAEGLVRTSEKRNFDHFDWLARYQAGKQSYAEIWNGLKNHSASAAPDTRQGIEMAITRLAKEIELTLRR